ncbi:hypothetical protein DDZ13_11095 [Coraliomargarita sinensis]|uniref:Uncharacterized protein n=1 Tax=Coraliomargarita sinensis TaxID=2174842 RepID=A0A317ZF91_9BACT|nr:hypothetical protein [Coraliomargarita sinensis]PXA03522.1 hypothetical protein DDZ13_11095 [Coraliomargarita sinensis]
MKPKPRKFIPGLLFWAVLVASNLPTAHAGLPDDTTVYWNGSGKRVHIEKCRRLTDDPAELAKLTKMTLAEAKVKELPPCSRCPGSELNEERLAETSDAASQKAKAFPPETKVYWDGGKRGHIASCRRFPEDKEVNSTYGKMTAAGAMLCSRCPGSQLNVERKARSSNKSKDYGKYGRKGAKARAAWLNYPEKEYDPKTKAYCDALWMRVHEESCPMVLLKDKKRVITLEQADKEGWRIGETGQSGRERCCFHGYRRNHPEKEFNQDTPGLTQIMKSGRLKWHQAGCHRFIIKPEHVPMTMGEAMAKTDMNPYVCVHCIERGPNLTTVDLKKLRQRPTAPEFTPPAGWTPEPFSPDKRPSEKEIDILIQETLARDYSILEAPFENPLASLEEFMGMRFFFPVDNWLTFYQAYRATGDKRILESLRVSARHYRDLCNNYPDVAQLKARDPEGMAFMYSMAVSARLTLKLARKHPEQVNEQEIAEAASFLKAIVSTLKPVCEGDDNLDSEMGIPKELADDFRRRAFNRALNGIGTIAMATAALEDLQVVVKTSALQPQIDRYRKCVREYFKNWKSEGCLYTEADGKTYFYYPYIAGGDTKRQNGLLLGGADDQGHYSHSMQGVMLVHDATPELGADDEFMTAVANAVYHNSYTKNGSIQCPSADKIQPLSRKKFGAPIDRFYMFEAFRDGVIEGQCSKLSPSEKVSVNSEYSSRLKTLHAQYLKALRENPGLIHL